MTVVAEDIRPLRPEEMGRLAATEYARFEVLLRSLAPGDWSKPTDCSPWTVREIVAHVTGATEAHAHPREMLHQLRRGVSGIGVDVDGVNAVQVRDRARLDPEELIDRFSAARRKAARTRYRLTRHLGRVPFRVGAPIHETWRLDYLFGLIYTRDTWMHRIDIGRATSRPMVLSAEHDGVIVADVVRDWARRHGQPFHHTLTGPAGRDYVSRAGPRPDIVAMDPIEFARVLSGRAPGVGLLAVAVPF